MASDLDGAPVFMASTAFSLQYEQDRWKAIRFSDVKDYQRQAKAA
jgi:peptide chain release factor 3